MLIGTLVVSLLLCVGLALWVLYLVAAPHLRASGNRLVVRATERIDAAGHRIAVLVRTGAAALAEAAHRHVQARRGAAEESGSARLHG